MKIRVIHIFIIAFFLLASCQSNTPQAPLISVTVIHDQKTDKVNVPKGASVQQSLAALNLTIGTLDKVEPDLAEIVNDGETIKVTRVIENFIVEETTLPFESQTVKNESLAVGQTLLIQAGENGIQSNTYRVLSEDGIEKSRTIVKSEVTKSAQPEIIMVGIQSPFKPVSISGIIAYISSSNAWIMESNTGNRKEVANSGDLDGRIFSLSPDGKWLLFSRTAGKDETETVNSLWVVNVSENNSTPISLNIKNVPNYAEWVPEKALTIAYSTVEWRSTAPGWQANNDLQVYSFDESGKKMKNETLISWNLGGVYSWWGTSYAFSPDDSEIAYTRPDSIGLVESKTGQINPLSEFSAYQAQGDWAWVPGIAWSADHSVLFFVKLVSNPNNSDITFDLDACLIGNKTTVTLQENTGMFAYPSVSPVNSAGKYSVAYLSANLPDQSSTSRYDLRVMDRDGSNMKKLYPEEGIQGLDPQKVIWSPLPQDGTSPLIAFIAQGNLMFVNPDTGSIQQITGDGSITTIDWK